MIMRVMCYLATSAAAERSLSFGSHAVPVPSPKSHAREVLSHVLGKISEQGASRICGASQEKEARTPRARRVNTGRQEERERGIELRTKEQLQGSFEGRQ
eukprot:345955-Rhodomonas_salina.3